MCFVWRYIANEKHVIVCTTCILANSHWVPTSSPSPPRLLLAVEDFFDQDALRQSGLPSYSSFLLSPWSLAVNTTQETESHSRFVALRLDIERFLSKTIQWLPFSISLAQLTDRRPLECSARCWTETIVDETLWIYNRNIFNWTSTRRLS